MTVIRPAVPQWGHVRWPVAPLEQVTTEAAAILARLDDVYPEVVAIACAADELLIVFSDATHADQLATPLTAADSDARYEQLRDAVGIADLLDAVQATARQLCAVAGVPADIPPRPVGPR